MERIKYITNRDLLAEIHRSKSSFCYFDTIEHGQFDLILGSLDELTAEAVTLARVRRAAKLSPKAARPDLVDDATLVYRVMGDSHIPLDETGKRRNKLTGEAGAIRTNFPAFSHYVLQNGVPVEVGRSHWTGDLATGEFCADGGKINNRLATMFVLLVERYARRGNWRGYCCSENTEALTQRGWLKHDEITEADIILSYDQEDGQLKWSKIKSIFRDNYDGNMFHLTVRGMDALVTPGHRFITTDGLKRVEYLLERDRIVLMGGAEAGAETKVYSDDFVEIVGWMATEGNYDRPSDRSYHRASLYQNHGLHADRIRHCLQNIGDKFSEYPRKCGKQMCFNLGKDLSLRLAEVMAIEGKVLTMPFILALTKEQRQRLVTTMVDGDGWIRLGKPRSYCQKNKAHVDAFRILCTLAGLRTSATLRNTLTPPPHRKPTTSYTVHMASPSRNITRVENIDFHGAKRSGTIKGRGKLEHPNEPTVPYKGIVWCPETEYGTFIYRRNETIYCGANTYNDDMRSLGLLQLSYIGLQFDENKSENPFAFYTQVITNCFRRVLHLERRHQHIRDDLLIIAGVAPSYTRQIEHEMEQQRENALPAEAVPAGPVKKPRGRKPKPPAAAP